MSARRRAAVAVSAVVRTGLQRARALTGPGRQLMVGATVVLALALPVTVLVLAALGAHVGSQAALGVPAGQSHDGATLRGAWLRPVALGAGEVAEARAGPWLQTTRAVSGTSLASAAGLSLRWGCAWGDPGRNPYRGSTEQALQAAGLPAEVVADIAAQRAAGRSSERLLIQLGSIQTVSGDRTFDPRRFDMSFGMTMCRTARVNFAPGHVEQADLYEATDAQGRQHVVMVPDVCGNVSVLHEGGEPGLVASMAMSLAERGAALGRLAEALTEPPPERVASDATEEPGPSGSGLPSSNKQAAAAAGRDLGPGRVAIGTSVGSQPGPAGQAGASDGGPSVRTSPPAAAFAPPWTNRVVAAVLTDAAERLADGSELLRTVARPNPPPQGKGTLTQTGGPTADEEGTTAKLPLPVRSVSTTLTAVSPTVRQVAEPATLPSVLLALGLAALVMRWRRRR